MAIAGVRGKVTGLENLLKQLGKLERKVGKKLTRDAVRAAAKDVVLKELKTAVPVDTGSLRTSLGYKVKTARKTGVVYAIVGPRSKFMKEVVKGKGWKSYTGRRVLTKVGKKFVGNRWPTKYAHLTEFGTKERVQKTTGRRTGSVKAKHWMQKTITSTATAVQAKMADVLRDGLKSI